MKQEDKDLLLKDLCARLPYGVMCYDYGEAFPLISVDSDGEEICLLDEVIHVPSIDETKPYLRPMSSMTEEEMLEINALPTGKDNDFPNCSDFVWTPNPDMFDWLNAHHFDYRGLIEKGLAIEVTEENNPYD